MQIYHILNGDALHEYFPKHLEGEGIIMRECLIDGPVHASSLEEFYELRAEYISAQFQVAKSDYHEKIVSEIEKINSIASDAKVYLWFEEDLFCQTNFWFVCYLLSSKKNQPEVFLIKPESHTPYSFANYSKEELPDLFDKKIKIENIDTISNLWKAYASDQQTLLNEIASEVQHIYPFILSAVEAHLDRSPNEGIARPQKTLLQIMKDLNTKEFTPIFQEFCKREAIYGFGDVQVKRMYDKLLKDEP